MQTKLSFRHPKLFLLQHHPAIAVQCDNALFKVGAYPVCLESARRNRISDERVGHQRLTAMQSCFEDASNPASSITSVIKLGCCLLNTSICAVQTHPDDAVNTLLRLTARGSDRTAAPPSFKQNCWVIARQQFARTLQYLQLATFDINLKHRDDRFACLRPSQINRSPHPLCHRAHEMRESAGTQGNTQKQIGQKHRLTQQTQHRTYVPPGALHNEIKG